LKQHTESFVERYYGHLSCHVESTLLRIGFCRTAPMKGRVYRCPSCDSKVPVYNSCTDRHCPQCRGASRADWVDKTAQLLRDDTKYFQVVFTLPDKLSSLVLGNRRLLYRLLFRSAASALQRSIGKECGMQAALSMVLHTWNQRLGHHPHVHALVPGSGPSLDGTRWVPCRSTPATRTKPARPFLVDNKELGRCFRDSYLRGVRRLIQAGRLEIDDLAQINTILDEVQACDWVVFIQPPPKDTSDPADVLKYLARDRLQPVPPSTAADPADPVSDLPPDELPDAVIKCPHCQTEMELESHTRRPSWRELFYGPDHPRWMEWRGSG
jgi:hypothetical protein